MRCRLLLAAAASLAALAACTPSEHEPQPAHDIAYYRDHPDERAAKMKACADDPGGLAATSNCVNALGADGEATSKRFWAPSKAAPRVADPAKL